MLYPAGMICAKTRIARIKAKRPSAALASKRRSSRFLRNLYSVCARKAQPMKNIPRGKMYKVRIKYVVGGENWRNTISPDASNITAATNGQRPMLLRLIQAIQNQTTRQMVALMTKTANSNGLKRKPTKAAQ